jgi:negative regulator of flagellin synthesis FlgM
MKISQKQIHDLLQTYSQQAPEKLGNETVAKREVAKDKASGPVDKVIVSDQAREVRKVKEAVAKLPEVRQERVEELKKQVAEGTYKPKAEDIAEKLLGRILGDRVR